MEGKFTSMEFRVLINRFLEDSSRNRITFIQNFNSSPTPLRTIRLGILRCKTLYNGYFQLETSDGTIELDFRDHLEDNGFIPLGGNRIKPNPQTISFSFKHDEEYKGYWLKMGDTTLFFGGVNADRKLENLFKNIKKETAKEIAKEKEEQALISEANSSLDKETWEAIDNMFEK